MSDKPKGILRNKDQSDLVSPTGGGQLDRNEVIKNTRLNAQLKSESSKGDKIRAKIADAKTKQVDEHESEDAKLDHLKWDEVNLYKSEQEKCATMKIDEPKTPYVGGFNPEGEYYNDDDDEIPNFELGEGETDNSSEKISQSTGGGELVEDSEAGGKESEGGDSQEETAEERHARFERLRKEHYHMKGDALRHKIDISDDDDDDDDER